MYSAKTDRFLYISENIVAKLLTEEEPLDRTRWKISFGRSCRLVVRQKTE
jgi:hypothetical protein